ncbi:hypothetical protein, conserved in T. vivax [Trypanosoma vivax Y486]|uniref:Uncharacterized protein n=1 Tax=Trypanosoma vivax (strain Y486) TaxID=1055687 RepID=F9WM40_TRYVY|nr:hypothetical protein, conserved in T. vivax [Trypanosoma vivax Y486]|eukprot:CCD18590.1 hypothetical protein, conserved in T. vivax [Trypanosoma vivax Y486]
MTRLALAMACLLAGTLVSTRRGSAAPAEAGANIGAASILCEAALQADAISEQAKALQCDAVKRTLEETLNSVPAEVWDKQLKRSGRLRNMTMNIVGRWERGTTLAKYCDGPGKNNNTRVCSAKKQLDTCTGKPEEPGRKVRDAVDPTVGDAGERWWVTGEQTSREAANAKNLCLGATMVYLCTGENNSNPCFSAGIEPDQLKTGITKDAQTGAEVVANFWTKAAGELCTRGTRDRNIRTTIARFWAEVRDRRSGGNKGPQLGVCVNYGGTRTDTGCLEYATTNTTEVFWMKTLLEADDALLEAEHALAAASRTLDDVTRLTARVHDRHELLVAALNRENGGRARDAAEAPRDEGQPAETGNKGDAQRDSREATRTDTTGEASTAETQSSTDSAHFGWLGVSLAAGMTTFAGRHNDH